MKVVNMRKYEGQSKTKAFFDVETVEGLILKGFKLVEGNDGLFLSNPSEFSKKDEKWFDRVIIPREMKDDLEREALQEYGIEKKDDSIGPF